MNEDQIKQQIEKEVSRLEKALSDLKNEVKNEVIVLEGRINNVAKSQDEVVKSQNLVTKQSQVTHDKASQAKHAAENIKAYMTGFIELSKENQKAIYANQEAIVANQKALVDMALENKEDRALFREALVWFTKMRELATNAGWEEALRENKANTKDREMRQGWKQLIVNAGIIIGAIMAAIGLAKAIGLFRQ